MAGERWENTLTVGELREMLSRFPDGVPVIAEWEGTWNCIVDKEYVGWTLKDGVLILDVDKNKGREHQL